MMPAGRVLIHRVRRRPVRIRGDRGNRLAARSSAVLRLGHDTGVLGLTAGLHDRRRVLASRSGRWRHGGVLIYRATASVLITTAASAVLRALIAGRLAVLACISLSSRVIARLTAVAVEVALLTGTLLRILIRTLTDDVARPAATAGTGGTGARVLITRRRGAVLTRRIVLLIRLGRR